MRVNFIPDKNVYKYVAIMHPADMVKFSMAKSIDATHGGVEIMRHANFLARVMDKSYVILKNRWDEPLAQMTARIIEQCAFDEGIISGIEIK